MKKLFLMLALTSLAFTASAQSQLTTVRGKTKEGKTIKVEYYKGSVEDYVESVKYQLVDELQVRVDDLQTRLDAANKQIKDLKARNDKEHQIEELYGQIDVLNENIKNLKFQLSEKNILYDSLVTVNSGLHQYNSNIDDSNKEIDRLRDSIVSKDAAIRKLRGNLAECERRATSLEDELLRYQSAPVGAAKPTPVIGVDLGVGPTFATGVEENWDSDINWVKKGEVYFGTARLARSFPISIEAGVGIRGFKLSASRQPYELTVSGTDSDGDSYQAIYTYGTLEESFALTYLDIPIRVCFRQPAKNRVDVYAKLGVTPSVKIADKFQGRGTYSLKGYYPQWDVTLENVDELGFGSDMDYYTADNEPVANAFLLWGNVTLGAYVPFKGSPILLNAGVGFDFPIMNIAKTNAGSKAIIPALELGMVYTLK